MPELQTSTSPNADPRVQAGGEAQHDGSEKDVNGESENGDVEKQDEPPLNGDVEKAQPAAITSPPEQDVPQKDASLVEFDGPDDPGNPKNWSVGKRISMTMSMAMMCFVVTFSSSIFAAAIEPVSAEYNISTVTATLGVSLFLLGFVLGPIAFGPASEVFGRRLPLMIGYFAFAVFQIPVAVARNVETIMLGRFFSGLAAAAPLSVIGGALADVWGPVERAYAICAFAGGVFCGPVVGPVVGGFVVENQTLGWRWTAWFTLIMAALFGIIGWFVIDESSAPRILQLRAKKLRYETKNWALHAKADEQQITANTILTVYLFRPFKMLFQEPILALMTAYQSFLYGFIYLTFEAFPYAFRVDRGWSVGISNLPFVSFLVGILMGAALMAYSAATNYKRAFIKYGKAVPEERLPPMIVGAIVLPLSLFWFAWTSSPHISWVPQVFSVAFVGMGSLVTFWQGINYLIDCYGFYSNSAIAVNTFLRSILGAVFPLFAPAMYKRLGVPWATSLLAFLCLAFVPAPVLFYIYGERIRKRSRFSPT